MKAFAGISPRMPEGCHFLAALRQCEPAHFWLAANRRRQVSQRQSENRVRSSASVVGSRRMVAHQHPASCWQLNGSPQLEHFFSTVAGMGSEIPRKSARLSL
jgi:hypothetical protein